MSKVDASIKELADENSVPLIKETNNSIIELVNEMFAVLNMCVCSTQGIISVSCFRCQCIANSKQSVLFYAHIRHSIIATHCIDFG